MRMIKLTLDNNGGEIWVAPYHIVSMQPVRGQGTIVDCVRGRFQVKQSVDQLLKLMGEA